MFRLKLLSAYFKLINFRFILMQKEKDAEKQALADKKAAEQKKKEELAELFKPVQTQKVPFGVDPKTIVCQFFKAGQCQKGDKCKFSHDLNVDRKVQKIDLYTDARNEEEKKDGMKDFIALYLFIHLSFRFILMGS